MLKRNKFCNLTIDKFDDWGWMMIMEHLIHRKIEKKFTC